MIPKYFQEIIRNPLVEKERKQFCLILSVAVLCLAFCYGVAAGLREPLQTAEASTSYPNPNSARVETSLSKLNLVAGIRLFSIGENTKVNGRASELASFVSNQPIKTLLSEQTAIWEQNGFKTVGIATSRRGMVFAIDKRQGARYSISAWASPSPFAASLPRGYAVEGLIARMDSSANSSPVENGQSSGEITGIPIRPGGAAGAIISSEDYGQKSFTSVYSLPETLEVNLAFYRNFFQRNGWHLSPIAGQSSPWGAVLGVTKGTQEVVMIFAEKVIPASGSSQSTSLTTAVVTSRDGAS